MKIHRFFAWAIPLIALGGCAAPNDAPPPTGEAAMPIVGGFVETARRYPIALRFEHPQAPGQFFLRCSASLIGKRTVLTAGHCVFGDALPPPSEVVFGPDVDQPQAIIPIVSIELHPQYLLGEQEIHFDIGMVKLAADAPEQPVGLLRETMPAGSASPFVGPDVTFVGYGVTQGGGQDSGMRRVVSYPLWAVGPTNVQGLEVHESAWLWVDPNMAEATCNGDSGGPAYFVGADGVERQLGVHSTSNCVNAGTDTRADQFMIDSFVQAHIDAFEGGDPCRSDGSCNAACQTGSELVDPDCAAAHCATDGVCARSCVMPLDVDCAWGQSFCQDGDGACNGECAALDAECAPFCGPDGVCVKACARPDVDCIETSGAGGSGGGAGVGGGSQGEGGGWTASFEDDADDGGGDSGCAFGGTRRGASGAWWLLAAVLWRARARRRRA